MLADWFKGGSEAKDAPAVTPEVDAAAKRDAHRRKLLEDEPQVRRELTAEELDAERTDAMRAKLRRTASESRPAGPNNAVTYDSMFRAVNRLMLSEQHAEFHNGLTMQTSRQVHNMQVQSKFTVGTPQTAGWELTLQTNGFSDVNAVTYNSLGRYQLMHQRVFKSGALAVTQFMGQAQAGAPGTFFGMVQYPWMRDACTQLTYLKTQHLNLSHAARLVRNLTVGANMTYDLTTKATSISYGFLKQQGNVNWVGQWTPDKGEWKIATTRHDWELDTEVFAQLELATARGGDKSSVMSFGIHKPFIGGSVVSAVLTGFTKLKAVLDLPFGCDRPGMNQVGVRYTVQYDAAKGAVKHGLSVTA